MGAEDEAEGFGGGVGVAVADGAVGAGFVDGADGVEVCGVVEGGGFLGLIVLRLIVLGLLVVGRGFGTGWVGDGGVGNEEGILLVAGGVLLGDEEGVEVPEAGFDVSVF